MLNCPHCKQPGVSLLRKLFLGPATSVACSACGKRVGVSYIMLLAVIPFGLALAAMQFVQNPSLKVIILVAGLGVMTMIHLLWVPLHKRE